MDDSSTVLRDRVVSMARSYPIARERLFRAWTDPVELAKWWGPEGWRVVRCELDVRPGGRWQTWFALTDGSSRSVGGVYREVAAPERLVFTWDGGQEDAAAEELSIVTVEFSEEAGRTTVSISHRKLTTGAAVDMDVGWNSTLDALGAYVEAALVGNNE